MLSTRLTLVKASVSSVRFVAIGSAVAFCALASEILFTFSRTREPFQLVLPTLLYSVAICLWLNMLWARTAALWLWSFIIPALVLGCLANPLFWLDFPSNSQPFGWALPSVYTAVVILGIWCWRVLLLGAIASRKERT